MNYVIYQKGEESLLDDFKELSQRMVEGVELLFLVCFDSEIDFSQGRISQRQCWHKSF